MKTARYSQQNRIAYLFISVPVILFILFTGIPIVMALFLSCTDYNVINTPSFLGLQNYQKLFQDEFFWIDRKSVV